MNKSTKNKTSVTVYIIAVLAMIGGIAVYYWSGIDSRDQDKSTQTTVKDSDPKKDTSTNKVNIRNHAATTLIQKILTGQKPKRPAFAMRDLKGKVRHIKEWDNKIVIINFWATWCPPCKREMPAFIDLYKKYKKSGVEIIGVAIDETESVKQFVDDIGVNYTILVGQLDAMEINRQYGNIRGQLPYTIFINRQQQIVAVKRGEIKKQEMERAILKLIGPTSSTQTAEQ